MRLRWLSEDSGEPGAVLLRRVRLLLTFSLIASNVIGAAVIAVLGLFVLPFPDVGADEGTAQAINLAAGGGFFLVVSPLGTMWGLRRLRAARDWLEQDRPPTAEERRHVLLGPRTITLVHAWIWGSAIVFFFFLNLILFDVEVGTRIAGLIGFGGISTAAYVYLISERQLRPAAARALAGGIGDENLGPGIKTRTLLAWALGSAMPILGLMTVGISRLTEQDFTADELAIVVLAIGGTSIAVGAFISALAARAVSDPVTSLRRAIRRVQEGELDVEVPVYDGSEIGRLQSGFNSMVAGLRERERIRDLFGRHVGEDVARAALDAEVELGGETREVSILFTDIIGSTRLAAERPAHDVVELLNRFFAVVVDVVGKHGGWVNKFEGDAALAVFGVPVELDDAPSAALAAARELADRIAGEVGGLEAAIGVSAGEVVAGNIGEESRFEYTVIGDPVNEASRLTELAKEKRGRLIASGAILEAASAEEAAHWSLDGEVTLRGRSSPTRLAMPVAGSR